MTPEELEAKRLAEEAEAQRLAQEAAATNSTMQPTDLMGQQGQPETGMDTNPMLMGGLGLGGGFVASQTGGAPATSQALSPFAQKVAAQDAANLAAQRAAFNPAIIGQNLPSGGVNPQVTGPVSQGLFQSSNIIGRNLPNGGANPQVTGSVSQGSLRPAPNRPVLIGQPQTYQGVPTGPNTPPQFTGSAPARPIPGTQLAPPSQPPAVSSAGGAPANTARPMKAAQRVGPPATIAGGAAATGLLARLNPYAAAATGGYLGGKAIDAFGGDALRAVGLTDREGNISDIIGSTVGEALYGDGNLPAFSEEELAQIQQGSIASDSNLPQMSRLGDEPLVFNAPTGPSSTATRAAQIAATLPDDSGLMGAPGIQGTGIPTTTIDVDGGSATVPQALADQTFRGVGSAPMSIEETRARLGGRTLNEYLNAPNGTEGVYGLRTDPQGRMIPAGFETSADAYRSYEDEAAAREGRLAARMQQPGESITERDTRIAGERTQSSQNVPTDVRQAMLTPEGRRTAKQINRLARWGGSTQGQEMGGVAGLEQSLQPVDAQKQQYDAMRVYKLGLEIDKMQQKKPSEYQEAAAGVDEAIAAGSIKPEDRNKFILRDLGWQAKEGEDSSDLMSIIYGDNSKLGGEPSVVTTQEDYENLAPGTRYSFQGKNYIKK